MKAEVVVESGVKHVKWQAPGPISINLLLELVKIHFPEADFQQVGIGAYKPLDGSTAVMCLSYPISNVSTSQVEVTMAVRITDLQEFGCPHCGFRSGSVPMSGGGCLIWNCGECGKQSIGLNEGLLKSTIGLGSGNDVFYPELRKHPRHGIPAHGRPDIRPEAGGEFFSSRGIGLDVTPGCFVCGGTQGMRSNIAAFVRCKDSGKRVVEMFGGKGARLDYREYEPDYVQVKVGACDAHVSCLENLHHITSEAKGTITSDMILEACNPK